MLLQNTVTRSLADDLAQHERSLRMMLANLSSAIQVASGGDIGETNIQSPELRALLENFVSSSDEIAYATLLNSDAKGISAGRIAPDAFLNRELERAYAAARDGRVYNGQALVVGEGQVRAHCVRGQLSREIWTAFSGNDCLRRRPAFLIKRRLREVAGGGLTPYVVDSQGRLVAAATPEFATGQDMKNLDIVRNFVEGGNKAQLAEPQRIHRRLRIRSRGNAGHLQSGHFPGLGGGRAKAAARSLSRNLEMQRTARLLALLAVLLSIGVSIFAARRITNPLQVLTQSSRALARGDFSQRVNLWSRTEIGELANTFNTMSDELEHFVEDLKRAAEENRELFMGSIQMLAGAVDEKDPYTRGHSDRVTRYSLLIAKEMKLDPNLFMETLQHLRPTARRGQDWHRRSHSEKARSADRRRIRSHEDAHHQRREHSAPGHAARGNASRHRATPRSSRWPRISLRTARAIRFLCWRASSPLRDTFDALTTNRPYQKAHSPEQALQIIKNLAGKRLDPNAVAALLAVYERGEIKYSALHHQAPDRAAAARDSRRLGRSRGQRSLSSRRNRDPGKNSGLEFFSPEAPHPGAIDEAGNSWHDLQPP